MKFVALVSGGKDSFYSILQAQKHGHELICCAHLTPPKSVLESNSFMYQSAGSNVIPFLTLECIGVPLVMRECRGESINTSLTYERNENQNDEVEDLYELLKEVLQKYPEVKGVCNGAILSNYQRVRVENVCSRLDLTPLSYLWRIGPQQDLLECMLEDGVEAVLVKTAAPGLLPRKHLNKTLRALYDSGLFERLKTKFDFHVCGEGGEYETLMLDCPLFKKKLVLDDVEIVYPDGNEDGDIYEGVVGLLKINSFHVEEKTVVSNHCEERSSPFLSERITSQEIPLKSAEIHVVSTLNEKQNISVLPSFLPDTKRLPGGLLHMTEMLSPFPSTSFPSEQSAQAAVDETLHIFEILKLALSYHNCTPKDVVYVHLYLSKISHFSLINSHYLAFFGSILPPSRSCVSVGENVLPGGRKVMMDVCVQSESGIYMRAAGTSLSNTEHNKLREVLHVQGLSYWAPVCVGPYSQANTIRGGLTMIAGQIGLLPPTMTLVHNTESENSRSWEGQLEQCWQNAASVLDALKGGGELKDSLGVLVYLSTDLWVDESDDERIWNKARNICKKLLLNNGGIVAGYVDERKLPTEDYGGYEDEETFREMEQNGTNAESDMTLASKEMPITMIAIPQMPVGALAEIELVFASNKATTCLGIESSSIKTSVIDPSMNVDINYGNASVMWNCGYKSASLQSESLLPMKVDANVRYVEGCCAMAWISVGAENSSSASRSLIDLEEVFSAMMHQIIQCAETAGMNKDHVLHIRLYYLATEKQKDGTIHYNDGMMLRTALKTEIHSWFGVTKTSDVPKVRSNVPAYTVVPVHGLERGIFAAQVMINDLVHMETDMWIHHGRKSFS